MDSNICQGEFLDMEEYDDMKEEIKSSNDK